MSSYVAPTAQFYPSASLRVTDAAVYAQIRADYNLGLGTADPAGSNIIIGTSPVALATQYGITWVDNPTTADYGNLPGVFTVPSLSNVNGTPITPNATQNGVQTLASTYTDANGQTFTTVTWAWQVDVQLFTVASQDIFSQQVVTWAGDGTAARLIPTTIDLTSGHVAILIFGNGGAPVWCTSAMIGAGKHATYSVDPASTTLGVMTLTASGFTVTGGVGVSVNAIGISYTAVVWKDSAGTKMQVGSYVGTGASLAVPTTMTSQISMLLYTGGSVAGNPDGFYCESDHGTIVVNMADNEAIGLTGEITSLGVGGWVVAATATRSNTLAHVYYYIAFAVPSGDAIRTTMLNTFSVAGTAGTDTVTGLVFTPQFAFARTYEAAFLSGSWRGPLDAGTQSHSTSIGGPQASGRLEAFGSGTITLGANLSPAAVTTVGFAVSAAPTPVSSYPTPTWTACTPIDNGDGTTSCIETTVPSHTPIGEPYVPTGPAPVQQWWCNATFGWSVFQIDSPGAGWVACSGPLSFNGWYLSTAAYGSQAMIVSGGKPADPRPWAKLATWCTTGNMSVYGGSPSASCNINNHFIYPASGYTVGTDYPPVRIFDGRTDRELCRLPPTTANVIPKAVMSMLSANGTVYLTSWDSGTTSADWNGRVFQLDPETGVLTVLGTVFANGELPYALCWHMGRLWCGTNNAIGSVGKIYFFRPGIDTAWTSDHATSADAAGGVTSMASFGGKLYVGTDNVAASRGKVLVRDTAGAYTTSQTGTGGTAKVNNGYLALTVLGSNLYASYWNNDTTVISKIEKFTGAAWSTAYTGTGTTLRPFIQLQLDNSELYALGGSLPYDAAIVVTADGTTWTDLSAELPVETATLLPMFGAVVT